MRAAATALAVKFPDPLRSPPDGSGNTRSLQRVDDPLADRIRTGDPTLGWEGDDRCQLYVDVVAWRWELWRWENNGALEFVQGWPCERFRAADIVAAAIVWLRAHDSQRGHNALEVVERTNAQVNKAVADTNRERVGDAKDRVVHGLRQDGAL